MEHVKYAFAWFFGESGACVIALAAFSIMDFITGIMRACREKTKTGKGGLQSGKAREGLLKKGGMFIIVLSVIILERLASYVHIWNISYNGVIITTVTTMYFIFTEVTSICENAAELGAKVPPFLLKRLKDATDKTGNGELPNDETKD